MKETKIETYIVNSFTNKPFKGNPAGVCVMNQELSSEKMQSIAKELGFSETAFIMKTASTNKYLIRYFSPKTEIPLCGHATLASAKVLFEINAEMFKIHFRTIQNLDLLIKKEGEKIEMHLPSYDTVPHVVSDELLNALGLCEISNCEFNKETNILLLEIADSNTLNNLTPDFQKLKSSHNSINGVLVTAISERTKYDFESRYFWPWSGTNEDPVTGATHTFLTKYWKKRLNKTKMNSFQCSQRTGFMEVELTSNQKVIIKSEAQIILKGELRI